MALDIGHKAFEREVQRARVEGRPTPSVVIVGGGLSGLATAIQLVRAGVRNFTLIEQSDGVGGTWRDNSYPGSACDVPSHLYSFSFSPKTDWSRRFAEQPEILSYAEDLVGRYHLAPHLRLGTTVQSAVYDEVSGTWLLDLHDASGANVLFGVVLGKFTSQMIKGVAEISWKPDLFFVPTSASSISFLEPAGLENAVGLISSSNQKDTIDVQWAEDSGVQEFFAFMKRYLPNADLNNSNYAAGYHYASLLVNVLRACKDDFSRENIMRQAASLREVQLPLLLPGMTVSTGPDDYLPFQQLRLRRFNGKSWVGFGDILDDR